MAADSKGQTFLDFVGLQHTLPQLMSFLNWQHSVWKVTKTIISSKLNAPSFLCFEPGQSHFVEDDRVFHPQLKKQESIYYLFSML